MVIWRAHLFSILSSLFLLTAMPNAVDAQDARVDPMDQAARIAKEACQISSQSGATSTIGGKASGTVDGFISRRLLGVEGGIEGTANVANWSGIQQVLREHQLADSQGIRECSIALLPVLLQFRLEWLKATAVDAAVAVPAELPTVQSNSNCHPAEILRNDQILVEAGTCFIDRDGRVAQILSARRDVVVFSSAGGTSVRCYVNERCTLGFDDDVRFGFLERDGKIYLVRKL